ncbi:MAG: glutaminyl-peptide cyclotransferase [Crocinitomicaceae bacterium]
MRKYLFIGIVVLILILIPVLRNCESSPEIDDADNQQTQVDAKIIYPERNEQFVVGDEIEMSIEVINSMNVSQMEVYLADELITKLDGPSSQIVKIETKDSPVGTQALRFQYIGADGKVHQDVRNIVLFSDIKPVQKKIKVEDKRNHEVSAYTQGLEFYKGRMYESTGQYGTSYVAEVDLVNGYTLKKVDLPSTYFGEGLTILNDTIYQITWQSGVCKLYDMELKSIGEFAYTGEGWGLTNNGKSIIMSNGSDKIVWRDPKTFAITKEIQVVSDQSGIGNLNELELINGSLFANIYTDNKLVEIDTATGKVLSFIDASEIVIDQPIGVDYLNGIAHNKAAGKTYLTGKLWPSLYEVTFE